MYINWQELRAAKSAGSGNVMQLYLDNMTAIAFIRRMGGTHTSSLCKESLWFWLKAISRELTILQP